MSDQKMPDPECRRCGRLVRDCPRASFSTERLIPFRVDELDCLAHEYLFRALKAEEERDALTLCLTRIADGTGVSGQGTDNVPVGVRRALCRLGAIAVDAAGLGDELQRARETAAEWQGKALREESARRVAEQERDESRAELANELDRRRTALEALRMTYDDHKRLLDIISPDPDLTLEEGGIDKAIEIVTSTRKARDVAEAACSTWAREADEVKRAHERLRVGYDLFRENFVGLVDTIASRTEPLPEGGTALTKSYFTVVDAIAKETTSPEDAARIARETRQERDRLQREREALACAAGLDEDEEFTIETVNELMESSGADRARLRVLAAVAEVPVDGLTQEWMNGLMRDQARVQLLEQELSEQRKARIIAENERAKAEERLELRADDCMTCGESLPCKDRLCDACADGVRASAMRLVGDRLVTEASPPDDIATRRLPPSRPSTGPVIAGLVAADLFARAAEGERQYGQPLRAFNARPAIVDGYQEVLDLASYMRQDIAERRAMLERARNVLNADGDQERLMWSMLEEIERWLAPYEANSPAHDPQPVDGHPTLEWVTRQAAAWPACTTCSGTHRVVKEDKDDHAIVRFSYLCMDCPLPCHKCVGEEATVRSYCSTHPCPCLCHQPAQKAGA